MKKIIAILFSVILIFLSVVQIYLYNAHFYSNQLFQDKMSINIIISEGISDKEVLDAFYSIDQKYHVSVAKYVFTDTDIAHVFTTAPSNYVVTREKGENRVITPINNHKIFINSMDRAITFGLSGSYYVSTKNMDIVLRIVNDLNMTGIGQAELNTDTPSSDDTSELVAFFIKEGNFPALVLLIISCFIGLFIIIKVGINESKKIAILQLQGFSKTRIVKSIAFSFSWPIIFSLLVSMVSIYSLLWYNEGTYFLPYFIGRGIFNWILLILGSGLILFCVVGMIHRMNKKNAVIKGYTASISIYICQYILKYLLMSIVVITSLYVVDSQRELGLILDSDKNWKKAENIYRIDSRWVTFENEEERRMERASADMYRELAATGKLFLIDAHNYEKSSMHGLPTWKDNMITSGESIYADNGKCINIDENYIKRNPVMDVTGKSVLGSIIHDDKVRNILVPISLRDKEKQIRKDMMEQYIHKKITVPNLFKREDGNIQSVEKDDLKLNIIYVKNNTKYFTYDSDILPEEQNLIIDPIVIVDTGHDGDASYYSTYYAKSIFLESTQKDPFLEIRDTVIKYNLLSSNHGVISVYNERAKSYQEFVDFIKASSFVIGGIAILYTLLLYMLSQSYFEQYKYEIFIKRMHGLSAWKIFRRKLITEIILDVGITIWFGDIRIIAMVTLFDILLLYINFLHIYKKSILRVIWDRLQ